MERRSCDVMMVLYRSNEAMFYVDGSVGISVSVMEERLLLL
jgi:hypothetical protein